MPDPIPGDLSEWVEIEPTRWERTGHPEDGIICVTPPKSFEEYYAERLEPPIVINEPTIEDRMVELEAKVAALETKG